MSARRLLLATVLPAALLAGPLAGAASASTPAPAPAVTSPVSGTLTFAARAEEGTPITKVEVDLPIGTPMQDVTVPAMDGWTSASTTVPLPSCGAEAVNSVTWTATGGGVAPAGTGNFAIQVGRVADADQVVFSGLVTYADGTVAGWTEQAVTGAPALPAPFFQLARGTQATPDAAAVTVNAAPTAPRPDVASAPATLAPSTLTPTWTGTFVTQGMPVW